MNYTDHQSQCYVRPASEDLRGSTVRFTDLMGDAVYDRAGSDVASQGLYLDLPPWGYHVFDVSAG